MIKLPEYHLPEASRTEILRKVSRVLEDAYGYAPRALKEIILMETGGEYTAAGYPGYIMFRMGKVKYQLYIDDFNYVLEVYER